MQIPFRSMILMLAISACNSQAPQQQQYGNSSNESAAGRPVLPVVDNESAPPAQPNAPANQGNQATSGTPGTTGGLPDDRTPISEPKGPIDPKSAEGAGQVAQRYGGLLEQRRFVDARKLWADGGRASGLTEAQFIAAYDKYSAIHSEVGRPTDMEGAAGSVYITVPFRLYGTLKSGGRFNLVGPLTLRRVNDVPGSTEAQRRWHIEKSDLKPQP